MNKLEEENIVLKREIHRLKLQMRSKETIIKSIINKLKIEPPYLHFGNNLARMNLDELVLLEEKLK